LSYPATAVLDYTIRHGESKQEKDGSKPDGKPKKNWNVQEKILLLAGRCDKIHPITHLFSATACAACAVAGREGERGGKQQGGNPQWQSFP
jgi:hypothetical protein